MTRRSASGQRRESLEQPADIGVAIPDAAEVDGEEREGEVGR